jgi:hypothetical protein
MLGDLLHKCDNSMSKSKKQTKLTKSHLQAVYMSRLLNFKNLPEPRNANNKDNLLGIEYSGK